MGVCISLSTKPNALPITDHTPAVTAAHTYSLPWLTSQPSRPVTGLLHGTLDWCVLFYFVLLFTPDESFKASHYRYLSTAAKGQPEQDLWFGRVQTELLSLIRQILNTDYESWELGPEWAIPYLTSSTLTSEHWIPGGRGPSCTKSVPLQPGSPRNSVRKGTLCPQPSQHPLWGVGTLPPCWKPPRSH